ncbi:hypothetical protein [Spirillospora sp. CA-128828]|uniref:hypothetical protein n=1 Tax=Spirillospora sp. CA-128828 TaxID=3240033 RepID=UPI003D8B7DB1
MAVGPAGNLRTHRSAANWVWCLLFAAIAVTLPTFAIRDAQRHAELLRHHGVRVTADVLGSTGNSCDITFVDRSHGTPKIEVEKFYGCKYARTGEKLAVVYDPRHPSTIAYADSIGVIREYAVRAPLMLISLASGLGALIIFLRTRPGISRQGNLTRHAAR